MTIDTDTNQIHIQIHLQTQIIRNTDPNIDANTHTNTDTNRCANTGPTPCTPLFMIDFIKSIIKRMQQN